MISTRTVMAKEEGNLLERAQRIFGGRIKEKPALGYFLDGRPINSIKLMAIVMDSENKKDDVV